MSYDKWKSTEPRDDYREAAEAPRRGSRRRPPPDNDDTRATLDLLRRQVGLTIDELARMLGLGRATMYRWLARDDEGRLAPAKRERAVAVLGRMHARQTRGEVSP